MRGREVVSHLAHNQENGSSILPLATMITIQFKENPVNTFWEEIIPNDNMYFDGVVRGKPEYHTIKVDKDYLYSFINTGCSFRVLYGNNL